MSSSEICLYGCLLITSNATSCLQFIFFWHKETIELWPIKKKYYPAKHMSSFTFVGSFCTVLIAFQDEVTCIFIQLMNSDEYLTLTKRAMSSTYRKMRILLKKIRMEQAILLWWNCFCLKSMFFQVQLSSQPHSFSTGWCLFPKGSMNIILYKGQSCGKVYELRLEYFRIYENQLLSASSAVVSWL